MISHEGSERIQWIPSRVNIQGEEMADKLGELGAENGSFLNKGLTSSDAFTITRNNCLKL